MKILFRFVLFVFSWILNYLRFADKDNSNSMNKRECRKLLTDSLNIELDETIFEQIYQDADRNNRGILNPEDFIRFFHLLARRNDLFQLMKKFVKNGDQYTIETISMDINELFDFLTEIQNVFEFCFFFIVESLFFF